MGQARKLAAVSMLGTRMGLSGLMLSLLAHCARFQVIALAVLEPCPGRGEIPRRKTQVSTAS